jgi:hypothetical protein
MPTKQKRPYDPLATLGTRKTTWIENTSEDRDSLHLVRTYPASNPHGIPDLPKATPDLVPDALIAFRDKYPPNPDLHAPAVHFYLDDYRFNAAWSKPWRIADGLSRHYRIALTPDFSLYPDMPDVIRRFNIYRNRWCGCFWHEIASISVIPSVSWLGPDSWAYCFAGIPPGSIVALNGIGHSPRGNAYDAYLAGFHQLLETIQPPLILSYGQMPDQLHKQVNIREYPTRWKQIKTELHARRAHPKAGDARSLLLAET